MWTRRETCLRAASVATHLHHDTTCNAVEFIISAVHLTPGFTMAGFCSAGSVCLDVINQTWSPMFGKQSHLAAISY